MWYTKQAVEGRAAIEMVSNKLRMAMRRRKKEEEAKRLSKTFKKNKKLSKKVLTNGTNYDILNKLSLRRRREEEIEKNRKNFKKGIDKLKSL